MDSTLCEPGVQHSSTISANCWSVANTTRGFGFHCIFLMAASCLACPSKAANSFCSSFSLRACLAFEICFAFLGISAVISQCTIPPASSIVSSNMLEGPLCDEALTLRASLVEGVVGMKDLPDRGFLCGLTWCSPPVKRYSIIPN